MLPHEHTPITFARHLPDNPHNTSWRAGVLATLACFIVLNAALYPLKSYFQRQHRTNMMQSDQSRDLLRTIPRYDWSTGSEPDKYWRYIPDAGSARLVVLDGMSQQYAINDEKPGDLITSEILDDSLRTVGARVFGIAAPNLNHEELLLQVQALVQQPATTPSMLVVGVCFDKMRNGDVRPTYTHLLSAHANLESAYRHFADSVRSEMPELSLQMLRTLQEAHSQDVTRLDQRMEQSLVNNVARVVPVIGLRQDLRSFLYEQAYLFRNWLFRIRTSTKRPVLRDKYTLNQQALLAAVRVAKQHGVKVLLYVIPLNVSADTPYIPDQYSGFKTWLQQLAQSEGVQFANLESVVERNQWGLLYGQPDFKHFKEQGHVTTANALLPIVRQTLAATLAP